MSVVEILRMRDDSDKAIIQHWLMPLPFRLLLIGRSQLSGKTNLLCNLLLRKVFYRGAWKPEDIYIISPSVRIDTKLGTLIEQLRIPPENVMGFDEARLEALYSAIQDQTEAGEKRHRLICIDDASFSGDLGKNKLYSTVSRIFSNGRHLGISCIATAQKYTTVGNSLRENATGIIVFACTNRQMETIADDVANIPRKEFEKMMRRETAEPHQFLFINFTKPHIYYNSRFEEV